MKLVIQYRANDIPYRHRLEHEYYPVGLSPRGHGDIAVSVYAARAFIKHYWRRPEQKCRLVIDVE